MNNPALFQLDRGGFFLIQTQGSTQRCVGWHYVERSGGTISREIFVLIDSIESGENTTCGDPNTSVRPAQFTKAAFVQQSPWTSSSAAVDTWKLSFHPCLSLDDYCYADTASNGTPQTLSEEWQSADEFFDTVYPTGTHNRRTVIDLCPCS